jgi:hypothetical protein
MRFTEQIGVAATAEPPKAAKAQVVGVPNGAAALGCRSHHDN